MKTKHYISIILGISILFFSSCDPSVDYRKIVQNDSKYDIMLIADTAISVYIEYNFDTIMVAKHSNTVIVSDWRIGSINENRPCIRYSDSLTAKIVDNVNLQLNLDLNDSSNWVFEVTDRSMGGGGECECRIKISDLMIK